MASPWSAPAWMKTSGSLMKGTLRPDAYDAFADAASTHALKVVLEGAPVGHELTRREEARIGV